MFRNIGSLATSRHINRFLSVDSGFITSRAVSTIDFVLVLSIRDRPSVCKLMHYYILGEASTKILVIPFLFKKQGREIIMQHVRKCLVQITFAQWRNGTLQQEMEMELSTVLYARVILRHRKHMEGGAK